MQLANERAFDQLDERWMEALDTAVDQLGELMHVAAWLVKARHADRAETLLAMLLEALEEQHAHTAALETARQALAWFPDHAGFRAVFVRAFPAAHPDNPYAAALVQASGLPVAAPLDECMAFIARRAHLRPGLFAIHRMRRIAVRLEDFDPRTDMLTLSDGTQSFPSNLATFLDQYDALDDNDFRATSIFCRPALAALAEQDPGELTLRYLKVSGRTSTFRDFKDALTRCAVESDDWKQWWSKVKPVLVAHPFIDLGQGTQPSLTLRDTPREAGLSWRTEFTFAAHPRMQPALVMRYASELGEGVQPDADVVQLFREGLAASPDTPPVRCFAGWLALSVLAGALGESAPDYSPAWLAAPDACMLFAQWCGWEPVYIQHCIKILPGADAAWQQHFAAMLPYAPLAMVEQLAAALRAHDAAGLLQRAIAPLAVPAVQTAEAFAWLWRALATEPPGTLAINLDAESATIALFKLIQQLGALQHGGEQNTHATLAALRHTLSIKHYDVIRAVMRQFGTARAAELYQLVRGNTGVSTAMRGQLIGIVSDIAAAR